MCLTASENHTISIMIAIVVIVIIQMQFENNDWLAVLTAECRATVCERARECLPQMELKCNKHICYNEIYYWHGYFLLIVIIRHHVRPPSAPSYSHCRQMGWIF